MTAFVIIAAVFISLFTSQRFIEAASDVGYPADAKTTLGRFRIGMVSGLSVFGLIVGSWLAVASANA